MKGYTRIGLEKRKGPIQDQNDSKTIIQREYLIPMDRLLDRHEMRKRYDKDGGEEVLKVDDSTPIAYSYIKGDLVYGWKDPEDLPARFSLPYGTADEKMDVDARVAAYKNFVETKNYKNNDIYVYTTFNDLPLSFLRAFRNNQDLYDCLIVPGMIGEVHKSVIFKMEYFDPNEDTSEVNLRVANIRERGWHKFYNQATNGYSKVPLAGRPIEEKHEFEDLYTNNSLEWFLPDFVNQWDNDGNPNLASTTAIWSKEWLATYKLNVIRQYKSDNRVTLLYRRSVPMEFVIVGPPSPMEMIQQFQNIISQRSRVFCLIKKPGKKYNVAEGYQDFFNLGRLGFRINATDIGGLITMGRLGGTTEELVHIEERVPTEGNLGGDDDDDDDEDMDDDDDDDF